MPTVRWELVAIVPTEESYKQDRYVEFVPEHKRYTPEEEDKILSNTYFYKVDRLAYDIGPVCGRQVGQIFDDEELWPDELPDEEEKYTGIYKLIFIEE